MNGDRKPQGFGKTTHCSTESCWAQRFLCITIPSSVMRYSKSRLLHPLLQDFESIRNIADRLFDELRFNVSISMKRLAMDKTGRFGLGFNSSYHICDVVSFVSRNRVVYFDPHRRYLPPGSSDFPGERFLLDPPTQVHRQIWRGKKTLYLGFHAAERLSISRSSRSVWLRTPRRLARHIVSFPTSHGGSSEREP